MNRRGAFPHAGSARVVRQSLDRLPVGTGRWADGLAERTAIFAAREPRCRAVRFHRACFPFHWWPELRFATLALGPAPAGQSPFLESRALYSLNREPYCLGHAPTPWVSSR